MLLLDTMSIHQIWAGRVVTFLNHRIWGWRVDTMSVRKIWSGKVDTQSNHEIMSRVELNSVLWTSLIWTSVLLCSAVYFKYTLSLWQVFEMDWLSSLISPFLIQSHHASVASLATHWADLLEYLHRVAISLYLIIGFSNGSCWWFPKDETGLCNLWMN